jgi:transposase-like protein
MDKKKYRIYTEEFRLEALELWKNSGKSAKKLEKELGISAGMLSKWRQKYQVVNPGSSEASLEPSDLEAAKREIKRLQKHLAYVEEEREILKKTIHIFSRQNP